MGEDIGPVQLVEAHTHTCTANWVRWTAWMVLMLGSLACKRPLDDPTQTAALYQKACDGGQMLGCNNLGVFYEHGTGVGQDAAKAAALYQKACDGGEMRGCNNLGFLHEQGTG